ncbi:MAG: DUF1351 domain-containing protein [Lachnospiraceae bacterium]
MEEARVLITQERAKISCNFEQVKAAIQGTLEEYKGAVFTEESKTYAKKIVAGLRADKKELQDNLKTEKDKYMMPWNEFETQAKELIALYDEPIDLINGQVQAFEKDRIAKKKEAIQKIYSDIVPAGMTEIIPLEKIYNSKWENATYKEKDVKSDISAVVNRIDADIATIKSMQSESAEQALALYKSNLDLTAAINHINAYERQKQEIITREQERIRRKEEARVRREEREKMLAEQRVKEEKEAALRQAEIEKQEALRKAEEEKAEALRQAELAREEEIRKAEEEKAAAVARAREEAAQEVVDSLIPDTEGEAKLYEYRMSLTDDAKEKLEMYLNSVGIEWEMIE